MTEAEVAAMQAADVTEAMVAPETKTDADPVATAADTAEPQDGDQDV